MPSTPPISTSPLQSDDVTHNLDAESKTSTAHTMAILSQNPNTSVAPTYGSIESLGSSANPEVVALFNTNNEEQIEHTNQALLKCILEKTKIIINKTNILLDTKEARIYDFSVAIPGAYITVASTFQGSEDHKSLLIMAGCQLALSLPMNFAYLYKKHQVNQSQKGLDDFIKYSVFLSKGFAFAFRLGCEVIAQAWAKELPANNEVIGVVTGLLASSLLLGAAECYGQSLPEESKIRRVTDSLFMSYTMANLVSDLIRIYNFAPDNNEHPETLEVGFSWIPIAVAGLSLAITILYPPQNKQLGQRLGTVTNGLFDVGNVFRAISSDDYASLAIILAKPFLLTAMHYIPYEKCIKKPSTESEQKLIEPETADSLSIGVRPNV